MKLTHQCNWSIHTDITALPRAEYLPWYWQIKFTAAKSVAQVYNKILHTCDGSGFKEDTEIKRYLCDGKAG